MSMLLGFGDPDEGQILVNGQNVLDAPPNYVRSICAYVSQETSLFNRTIRENITYGRPDATDQQVYQALKKADAYDFVMQLPEQLSSVVGERGVKLSGGQRQRIAIAREILKDRPLLLLDEATSALDSVSEQAIHKALESLMEGRTAIVIAHRLSTLINMDKILVLDKGQVVEYGSHQELLKQNGIYTDLWSRQVNGFLVDN